MNTSQSSQNKPSALVEMARRFNVDPNKLLDSLKATVFKNPNVSTEEVLALVVIANEYKLNPFTKQICALQAKGGGFVPVVTIDGWIYLCNSHPQYDGVKFEGLDGETEKPTYCKAIIYRKDRSQPTEVTERFSECFRDPPLKKKPGIGLTTEEPKTRFKPWEEMPHRMLRHKAFIQCARMAFGFSGITDEEEGRIISNSSEARYRNSDDALTKYTITRPTFEQLPAQKAELFTAPVKEADNDDIPMEVIVENSVNENK